MRKHRVLGWIALVVVLLGLQAYAVFTLTNIQSRLSEANREKAALEQEKEDIQEDNAALQYAIENQNDPETIEDIARSELGLVMPDEQIFYDAGE